MSYIKATSLGDLLRRSSIHWPDNCALVVPGEHLSYRELYSRSRNKAGVLRELGVGEGDHLGIMIPNSPQCLEWLFACAINGAVAVMINTRYKRSELEYLIRNADLKVLVTETRPDEHTDFVELLHKVYPDLSGAGAGSVLAKAPSLQRILVSGHAPTSDGAKLVSDVNLPHSASSESVQDIENHQAALSLNGHCLMMYTSGTTSNPKGCPLTHEAVTRKAFTIVDRLQLRESDRQWNPLPMFHLASLLPMFAIFAVGGTYITDFHFDPGNAWDLIINEGANILYPAFPVVMADLVTHPEFDTFDKRKIRLINNVAPPDQLKKNMKLFPYSVHISAYGLTEASGISCFSDPGDSDEIRARTIGPPLDGTLMKVIDTETGEDLDAGEQGELLIKGYSVFNGYYKAEEATRDAFTRDGWFRTGDTGSIDEGGRVVFHGRLKDVLKVGGENVSALEIESCLSAHPDVKYVQAVGVPDPKLQEVVAVFVELVPGSEIREEEIIGFCRERLASFKVPRYVEFVQEWPMSATKVQKFRLREQIVAKTSLLTDPSADI